MQTLDKIKKLITQGDLNSAFFMMQGLLSEENFDDHLLQIFAAVSVQLGQPHIGACLTSLEKIAHLEKFNVSSLLLQRNLLHATGDMERAVEINQNLCKAAPHNLDYAYELGVLLNQSGKYTEAINVLTNVTNSNPSHGDAYNERGLSYKNLKETQLAQNDFLKSIVITPSNPKGRVNLGNLLCDFGQYKEALEQYRLALNLNNKIAILHKNMGYCYYMLAMHDDAIHSFEQAALHGNGATSYKFELASALYVSGRLRQAALLTTEILHHDSEHAQSWELFGKLMSKFVWHEDDGFDWSPWLLRLLSKLDKCRPRELAKQSIAFLKRRTDLSSFLSAQWDINEAEKFVAFTQSEGVLLTVLMERTPLPDYEIESLLTGIRRYLLSYRNQTQIALPEHFQSFLATMALQCHLNEFIYNESEEEKLSISHLANSLNSYRHNTHAKEDGLTDLLLYATYRTVYDIDAPSLIAYLQEKLPHTHKSLIDNFLVELQISTEIRTLGVTSQHLALQRQYEENPYPQWTTSGFSTVPININRLLSGLRLKTSVIKEQSWPDTTEVLIAGCGTGEQSISTARRFANSKVTAIDISKRSLAYAKRKSSELNIENIEYMQCDLLRVNDLKRQFDVIESLGVLHHLTAPAEGLEMLVNVLKPGGYIKLGLYSKKARTEIIEYRKSHPVDSPNFGIDLIRKRRDSLFKKAVAGNNEAKYLTQLVDFYGASNCRDLLLHISEVQYDLLEIAELLKQNSLEFIGFEGLSPTVMEQFNQTFTAEGIYSLHAWHQYESLCPDTFSGMYQFWCVKH